MLFSPAIIQEYYLPATVGYCNAKDASSIFHFQVFYFDIKDQSGQKYIVAIQKNN